MVLQRRLKWSFVLQIFYLLASVSVLGIFARHEHWDAWPSFSRGDVFHTEPELARRQKGIAYVIFYDAINPKRDRTVEKTILENLIIWRSFVDLSQYWCLSVGRDWHHDCGLERHVYFLKDVGERLQPNAIDWRTSHGSNSRDMLADIFGAVAMCVGIDFGAISSVRSLPHHAARSMI
jgi:hypothetical protein